MKILLTIAALSLSLLTGRWSHPAEMQQISPQVGSNAVVRHAGGFLSPDGKCRAELKISSMGGFLVLAFNGKANPKIDDVTGIAWISADRVVYTTSPLHGHPGVYMYSCRPVRIKQLVAPETFNRAYPDGADYFALGGVSNGDPIAVYYYYAPDVDAMDVGKLRTPDHLFQLRLDAKHLEDRARSR